MSATLILTDGSDGRLPPKRDADGVTHNQHTLVNVYGVMLLQIMQEYPSLHNYNSLTMSKIRFFYDGLKASMKRRAKK